MQLQQILSKMEADGWEISDDFKTAHRHFLQYFFETVKEALRQPPIMPRFIITYKNDDFEKHLFWETSAKTDIDAVDLFWKTHDVMCEIISVNEA